MRLLRPARHCSGGDRLDPPPRRTSGSRRPAPRQPPGGGPDRPGSRRWPRREPRHPGVRHLQQLVERAHPAGRLDLDVRRHRRAINHTHVSQGGSGRRENRWKSSRRPPRPARVGPASRPTSARRSGRRSPITFTGADPAAAHDRPGCPPPRVELAATAATRCSAPCPPRPRPVRRPVPSRALIGWRTAPCGIDHRCDSTPVPASSSAAADSLGRDAHRDDLYLPASSQPCRMSASVAPVAAARGRSSSRPVRP